MRENNRKPIEKCRKKLPQFTTMNVIDGQAGLVIYSSLIFYSLTIDNILNIIVLLILAGVTIAALSGPNGILSNADKAKEQTAESGAREKINIAVAGSYDNTGRFDSEKFKEEIQNMGGTILAEDDSTITVEMDGYEAVVDKETGEIISFEKSGGVRPELEYKLYQTDGTEITDGKVYDEMIVTIKVTNEEEIDTINSIILKDSDGTEITKEATITGDGNASFKVTKGKTYTAEVKGTTEGIEKTGTITIVIKEAPEDWAVTTTSDSEWYSYIDANAGNGEIAVAKVNAPKLTGGMTPIKYVGSGSDTLTGSKWANATTSDGSMFVWIPRYAYKITSGYHQSGTDTTGGTIEIKFLKGTTNEFLDGSGTAETDPSKITYTGDVQNEWLVHPAFTDVEENGGWDTPLEGFWVGKFETTVSYTEGDAIKVTVKPGANSLVGMTVNEQYKVGKSATFGEESSELIGSHMAKNSEWGAVAYLSHSSYGLDGVEIEQNTKRSITGGLSSTSDSKSTIYTTNAGQSTTGNAYGVYDMSGGAYECTASYVNCSGDSFSGLGNTAEDIYNASNPGESSKYKTVYEASDQNSYNLAAEKKGDGVYETSNSLSLTGSWFGACSYFPGARFPFFVRGGYYNISIAGVFYFENYYGLGGSDYSFRVALAF